MTTLSRGPALGLTPVAERSPHRALWAGLLAAALLPLPACSRAAQPSSSPPAAQASSSEPVITPASSASSSAPVTSTTAQPAPSTSAAPHSTASSGGIPTAKPSTSTAAPPSPIAGLHGTEWTRIPTSNRVVALTFDAGANADGLASILATLATKRVPASFFLTGDWVRNFPSQARQVGSRYRVGNHSVSHPHFPQLTDAQVRAQLSDAANSIKQVTGADPAPWFRFPYGDRYQRTISLVNSAGYVPIGWTVDTLGWKGSSGGITSDLVLQRVLSALTPGEIVLMHVGSNPRDRSTLDADTLARLIDALRARGYGFVTLDAMLR